MTPNELKEVNAQIEHQQKAQNDLIDYSITAYRERLKEKVKAEIEKLTEKQKHVPGSSIYIAFSQMIGENERFLKLIDTTQ